MTHRTSKQTNLANHRVGPCLEVCFDLMNQMSEGRRRVTGLDLEWKHLLAALEYGISKIQKAVLEAG